MAAEDEGYDPGPGRAGWALQGRLDVPGPVRRSDGHAKIVAYCGLVCSDCDAYIATQANDPVLLERVVAKWRDEYHVPEITVAGVLCDGCPGTEGRHCGHWYECEIRACGMGRGVFNCAYCDDYGCERLERFWAFAPRLRALLDDIRAGRR